MRHSKKLNHLGRTSAHRQALMSNMAASLILNKNKRITTTLAKAKALRTYIEPLITRSKDDTTNSRRVVFSYLQSKEAVTELFREVAQKVAQRPGGYTRILKTGTRQGDNADMCFIELVDYNENMLKDKLEKKAKTSRRRGGVKKTAAKTETEETVTKSRKKTKEVVEPAVETQAEEQAVSETEAPAADETIEEPKAENKEEENKE